MDLIFWGNFEESRRKLTENTLFTPITRKYTIKRNPKDAVFDNQLHERSKFGDIWWYLQNFDVNKPKYTEKLYTTLVWNITERKRIQLLKVNRRNEFIGGTKSGRADCKNPRKPGSGVAGQRRSTWDGGGRWRTEGWWTNYFVRVHQAQIFSKADGCRSYYVCLNDGFERRCNEA